MSLGRITSRSHPLVQRFRALATRRAEGLVLLDGDHLVGEAIDAGVPIEAVITDGTAHELARRAAATGAAVYEAPITVVEAASPVRTPGGIVAIGTWAPASIAAAFDAPTPLVLGLVDVQDPGNVGSAIRSAAALGASGVVTLEASADPAGWKALRGAMGSTFRIPVSRGTLDATIAEAGRRKVNIVAAVAEGGASLEDATLSGPTLLMLGNEGAGLPASVIAAAGSRVTISMRAGVNSLNVSVTAALMLWEARQQRRSDGRSR